MLQFTCINYKNWTDINNDIIIIKIIRIIIINTPKIKR